MSVKFVKKMVHTLSEWRKGYLQDSDCFILTILHYNCYTQLWLTLNWHDCYVSMWRMSSDINLIHTKMSWTLQNEMTDDACCIYNLVWKWCVFSIIFSLYWKEGTHSFLTLCHHHFNGFTEIKVSSQHFNQNDTTTFKL